MWLFFDTLAQAAFAAVISAVISGGITSLTGGDFGDVLISMSDGLVDGFLFGAIFAFAAQGISFAIKGLEKIRVVMKLNPIGRNGLLNIGQTRIYSPNAITNPNAGGTLFKPNISKVFRFDVEAGKQLWHMHISHVAFNSLPNILKNMKFVFDPARADVHVRLTGLISGLFRNLFNGRGNKK